MATVSANVAPAITCFLISLASNLIREETASFSKNTRPSIIGTPVEISVLNVPVKSINSCKDKGLSLTFGAETFCESSKTFVGINPKFLIASRAALTSSASILPLTTSDWFLNAM